MLAGTIAIAIGAVIVWGIWLVMGSNAVPAGEQRAIHAVEAAGMHDVLIGGVDLLACHDNEASRHFSATNALGKRVEGTVCCGLTSLSSCTLRWGR